LIREEQIIMGRRIMLFINSFLSVTLITGFIFCSGVLAGEEIKIGGAGSALGSMKMLGAAFEKKHPGVKVVVLPSLGSIGGIKAVSKGSLDIGITGRPLNDEENRLGLSVIEYAKTPIVFATIKNISVSDISTGELVKIYKGDKQTWPNGERIRLILRQPAESNAIIVKNISPEISKAMDIALSRTWRVVALTDQETADMIEKTPGAFGFCTLTQIVSEKRDLKILSYNGQPPMVKNRVNGSYPIFKSHSMIIKKETSSAVKRFIEFARSSEGERILQESGNSIIRRASKE
jgi:phosphate transport system substrate-binding protein